MKTKLTLRSIIMVGMALCGLLTLNAQKQKEEVWKEATIFAFEKPYNKITINFDEEDFAFDVTDRTQFLLGKKKPIAKKDVFVGSTVAVGIVVENRKRVLTKVMFTEEEYGAVKKFEGVYEGLVDELTAYVDGRKVRLTDDTDIVCKGSKDCLCSKGRSFLGYDELELGSFLTVSGEINSEGVYLAKKIQVCKNTHLEPDQQYLAALTQDFDATNLKRSSIIPKGVMKAANGLHQGNIKIGSIDYKLLDDLRVQGYINMIGNRILPEYVKDEAYAQAHEVNFRFYVIESDVPNASALANGMVFINTGLLKLMENEAQIAAVLGHEIAHVTYEHAIRRYKATRYTNSAIGKKTTSWFKRKVQKKAGLKEGSLLDGALGQVMELTTPDNIISLFNKKHETQSDRAGLLYMAEAGYDPREAASFWQIMMENTKSKDFMSGLFSKTLNMVNSIETDLEDVDFASLGQEGTNILVKGMLETVYTSHPNVVKRFGDINKILSTTYENTDFDALETGGDQFNKFLGKLKR